MDKVKDMVKDQVKERVQKQADEKKAEQECLYCGQKVDDEVLASQFIETKQPIPRSLWALQTQDQSRIDDALAASERARLKVSKRVKVLARKHALNYMYGLGVEMAAGKHQWEFFCTDPMDKKPVYMGKSLSKEEQAEISSLHWELANCDNDLQDAHLDYKDTLCEIARDCMWGFRPIKVDRGYLVAPDLIDEAYKRGKKAVENKIEREKERGKKR